MEADFCTAVSDSQQVQDTIAKAAQDFGKLDVFIANAGTSLRSSLNRQS
jgi:NADP-dependent 3-hydroxy acid dehydrogenase YdfG